MKSKGPAPEAWTYNNLITAASWCLPGREALKQGLLLLEEMRKEGLTPNVFTYNALMQTGVKARDLAAVKRLFAEMEEAECRPDVVTFNTIIKSCLDKRDWPVRIPSGTLCNLRPFLSNSNYVIGLEGC